MASQEIAASLERAQAVYERRPEAAVHDDASGVVRWDGGLRMVSTHASGKQAVTDMPPEFGGGGQEVSPGWLLRSGVAACTATSIAMRAAREGIELSRLEVRVSSRSDSRGMLGMNEPDGRQVDPGPLHLEMVVSLDAEGVPPARLRELVEQANGCAPMTGVVRNAYAMPLRIEAGGA